MVAIDVSGVPPPTSRRAAKDSAVGTLRSQIPIGSIPSSLSFAALSSLGAGPPGGICCKPPLNATCGACLIGLQKLISLRNMDYELLVALWVLWVSSTMCLFACAFMWLMNEGTVWVDTILYKQ